MLDLLKDLWGFMRVRKKFWLAPIVLVLLLLGGLIVIDLRLAGHFRGWTGHDQGRHHDVCGGTTGRCRGPRLPSLRRQGGASLCGTVSRIVGRFHGHLLQNGRAACTCSW